MKNILLLAFLFLLLGMGCLASPSREHLCPDGTIVSEESKCPDYNSEIIDVNPQEFKTVFIKNNQNSYVMAGGEVQTEIIINKGESVWMLGDYISTDNSERYHRVNVINKKGNVYLINFSAPLIPGEFYFGATKRKDGGPEELIFVYNLTVIGEVSNETMAYSIAEMFMIANTPDQFNCPFICIAPSYPNIISFSPYRHTQNWNVTTENAVLREDGNWEVFMEASYDWCGDDLDMNICLRNNTLTGHFIISSKTGQIVG